MLSLCNQPSYLSLPLSTSCPPSSLSPLSLLPPLLSSLLPSLPSLHSQERICMADMIEVTELGETTRGASGFGSTGVASS